MFHRVLSSRHKLCTSYHGPYFSLIETLLGMTQPKDYAHISHTLILTYIMRLQRHFTFVSYRKMDSRILKQKSHLVSVIYLLGVHVIQTGVPSPFSSLEPSTRPDICSWVGLLSRRLASRFFIGCRNTITAIVTSGKLTQSDYELTIT